MTETQVLAMGGAIGVGCRLALGLLLAHRFSSPHGELMTNGIGPSLAVIAAHVVFRTASSEEARVALTSGALVGFMLLATFNSHMISLMTGGSTRLCLLLLAVAAIGCLAAGGIGLALARALV